MREEKCRAGPGGLLEKGEGAGMMQREEGEREEGSVNNMLARNLEKNVAKRWVEFSVTNINVKLPMPPVPQPQSHCQCPIRDKRFM